MALFFLPGGLGEDQGICMALALALALAYGSFSISTVPERVFFWGGFFFKKWKKKGKSGEEEGKTKQ